MSEKNKMPRSFKKIKITTDDNGRISNIVLPRHDSQAPYCSENGQYSLVAKDDGRANITFKNEEHIFEELKSSNKSKVFSTVILDDQGYIDRVRLPASTTSNGLKSNTVYRLIEKDDVSFFRAIDAPGYFYAGAEKKIDILDDWNIEFKTVASKARNDKATMLDYDRLYSIWQCVRNVADVEGAIVEIGVLRGGSSMLIAEACSTFDSQRKIYSCDTFEGHAEVDLEQDARHRVGTFKDRTSGKLVRDYLSSYDNIQILPGDIKDTIENITETKISFIHLDVDVYPTTEFVLQELADRIPKGGIILCDDYAVNSCPGVKKAIDEFMQRTDDFTCFHLLTSQAMLIRK